MLMKMSEYKSGTVFTVAICLSSILLAILVAYACDDLLEARDAAAEDYHDAQQALIDHESLQPATILLSVPIGGGAGALSSGITAGVNGATLSAAVSAGSKAVPGGAVAVAFATSCWWTVRLLDLQSEASEKSATYEAARAAYDDCVNPPAKYTFTDPNSGYVYEFCATMYGSDSAAYTAYMEFLEKRGY